MTLQKLFTRQNGLIWGALLVYLITRLTGLAEWPIYFFTDEAVQTTMAADFLRDELHNYDGEFLPTYFSNGPSFNLSSVSVYLQMLPYRLFGPSVFVNRAVSVFVSLLAAWAVGRSLQKVFDSKLPWAGILLLVTMPAWFLHSRTAFETVEMSAFYAGFLYFYMRYRSGATGRLFPALICGALAFYTYSPAQLIIVATGVLFLLVDLPYHWQQRRTALLGLLLLLVLAAPFARYLLQHTNVLGQHLMTRAPYWGRPGPLWDKLAHFGAVYLSMFDPRYWFGAKPPELERHLMRGYGHLMLWTAPLLLTGLWLALRRLRQPAYRLLLLAMLAAPLGSALVDRGVTRLLLLCVPFAILMTLGLEELLRLASAAITALGRRRGASRDAEPGRVGVLTPTDPPLPTPDKGNGPEAGQVIDLPLQVPDNGEVAAQPVVDRPLQAWSPDAPIQVSTILWLLLAGLSFWMLGDALVNGPHWYTDYTLSGMQYGARQLDQSIRDYLKERPQAKLIVSPSWANGTDVSMRFFWLPEAQPYQFGSVEGHLFQRLPLDENTTFVMLPQEFEKAGQSGKFTQIVIDKVLPYPNQQPGFYFVRMQYVPEIDEILAAERAQRRQLQQTQVQVDGQPVTLRYSMLDIGEAFQLFDGDRTTLTRSLEANPYIIELTFETPPSLSGLSVIVGSIQAGLKLTLEPLEGEPVVISQVLQGSVQEPEVHLDFGQTIIVRKLYLEVQDVNQGEPGHVHIWEMRLKNLPPTAP